jgi:hypothetical protein
MNSCRRPLAATTVGAVLLFVAGCGVQQHSVPAPPTTTASTSRVPSPGTPLDSTVSVTGSVTDSDGNPASLAVVSFDSSDDGTSSRSTISGDGGAYRLSLQPGWYTVSCTSLDGVCSPADADGDDSLDVEITTADTVDFVVDSEPTAPGPEPDSQPEPAPQPDPNPPAGDDIAAQCRAGGYNVCGRVTQGDQPVAGVILEAKFEGQHQEVTTNENGLYALKMNLPDAVLLCEGTPQMMDNLVDCSADGESQPVSIDSSVTGRIVNFVAASS